MLAPTRPRRPAPPAPRALASLVAVLAAVVLTLAAAAAAHAAPLLPGALPLTKSTESLGPGITLRHEKALGAGGWQDEQLVTIDLTRGPVSSDLLTSGPVASGGPLSDAVNRAHAVAGINGDFFNINVSNAALGPEVQGGQLLKSADADPGAEDPAHAIGVTDGGLARIVNAAVTATATFGGADHPVASVNTPDAGGVPAGGLVAYTPAWGTYSRGVGFTGDPDVAEAVIRNGAVDHVSTLPGDGAIPADGFVLVGRDASADALKALAPGDPVSLAYGLSDPAARQMRFAVGNHGLLVSGGAAVGGLDPNQIAPRTALGFEHGGRTLVLATWDGPGGTGHGGVTLPTEAAELAAQGLQTAVQLDGGGSTTMVARALGESEATVRNVPSDGHERSDPNGVGVFVAAGDGQVHAVQVRPGDGDAALDGSARVFPGLHRTLAATATDNHQTPVALTAGAVRWSASNGASITGGGVLAAAPQQRGPIVATAADGPVRATESVRVLGPIAQLQPSTDRLAIPDADASSATDVSVTGRDRQGFSAPVEPEDLQLDYDHSIVSVTPDGGQLKITPLRTGGTVLTLNAQGATVQLPVSVGVQSEDVYDFDDDVTTRWHNNSTAATTFSKDPEGLRIDFPAMRNVGITAATPDGRVAIPGQPLRVRVKIKSSISVPDGLTYINYVDGDGDSVGVYGTGLTASPDWQYATFTLPANTAYPIAVQSFQGINTAVAQQQAGTFVLGGIEADVPASVDLPAAGPPERDPLVSDDGRLPTGPRDWSFASISDIQFTADNRDLAQVATTAIHRIRETHPDLIVLNGDVTDRGLPQDLSYARQVLQDAGCDLIPVGSEPPPDSTPQGSTVPCYYVPGNHESYGRNNVQQDLTNFTAQFGRPYRYFDHKGTRFVLLASSLGTLHGTDFAQLPMLQQALDSAEHDPSVHNVVVFAHHPVDDPSATKSSQLGDRDEVALVERMLTDFRHDSGGKGAAMVGSHAQVANVHRIEGVPYVVMPSSGKDPYGTPDRGGFTGWIDWGVDPHQDATGQWLTADVRAFAQSVSLTAPSILPVHGTGTVAGTIVQPEGVSPGSRVVPLRYPMTVHWSGTPTLAIGSGDQAIAQARRAGRVAILDPATGQLTGLRAGSVTVTVTNDSMRPYTGPASLAPVTGSRTIQVVAGGSAAVRRASRHPARPWRYRGSPAGIRAPHPRAIGPDGPPAWAVAGRGGR